VREAVVTVLVGLTIMIGLLAIFIPVLPEMLLIWGACLAYGLLVGWGSWGPWLFGFITVLGIAAATSEIWAGGAGARIGGASRRSLLLGVLLGVLGWIFFSPLGGLAGLLAGIFIVEYRRTGLAKEALRAMLGLGVGYGVSYGIKLALGLLMAGAWLAWVLLG
jgi:uncharacterized protein YqgC (DUF456 family)